MVYGNETVTASLTVSISCPASASLFSGSYLYLVGGGQVHGDGTVRIFVCRLCPLALASDDVVVVGLALEGRSGGEEWRGGRRGGRSEGGRVGSRGEKEVREKWKK